MFPFLVFLLFFSNFSLNILFCFYLGFFLFFCSIFYFLFQEWYWLRHLNRVSVEQVVASMVFYFFSVIITNEFITKRFKFRMMLTSWIWFKKYVLLNFVSHAQNKYAVAHDIMDLIYIFWYSVHFCLWITYFWGVTADTDGAIPIFLLIQHTVPQILVQYLENMIFTR